MRAAAVTGLGLFLHNGHSNMKLLKRSTCMSAVSLSLPSAFSLKPFITCTTVKPQLCRVSTGLGNFPQVRLQRQTGLSALNRACFEP